MSSKSRSRRRSSSEFKHNFGKIMVCLRPGQQLRAEDEVIPSPESLATKDYVRSGHSSHSRDANRKPDTGNIEEAESSLRESNCLNYEEARALLGRFEYQKGNIEAALHVFEGIDIGAVTPKMKLTLARKAERHRRHSQSGGAPPMSIHAVSLLLEAIFLKAKSLQGLGRFNEAAQSCKVVLDILESSLPDGLPENLGADCKLQETLNKAVELLPELWKLAESPHEAILAYRRALLHPWNLDPETTAKIQKEFASFLLYSGYEAAPPNLRYQIDSSFVPRNNIEEAVLLLMILLKKVSLKKIEWDSSILDHLAFALSISGDLSALANRVEELLPGILDRKERYYTLALCYYGKGESLIALDLLRKLLNSRENPNNVPALLMASKICGETSNLGEEGVSFARRALQNVGSSGCDQTECTANYLLGVSLSIHSKSVVSDSERISKQSEALQVLDRSWRMARSRDPKIVYHLSLENAEQRKLSAALRYATILLRLEGGSNLKGWLLLARILSAQGRYVDAETITNAALEQTGKWGQGDLLRTKAKLQIAQGQLKSATQTYTQLLALLQLHSKSFSSTKSLQMGTANLKDLEMETWHDLARVYISLSQWRDAEICLSRSKAINPFSASRYHASGMLYEAKGLLKEALAEYQNAMAIDPNHVPSMISTAMVLKQMGNESPGVIRSFLMGALRLDRTNHAAWYNLGMLYKGDGSSASLMDAAACLEAAAFLEESTPVEPLR